MTCFNGEIGGTAWRFFKSKSINVCTLCGGCWMAQAVQTPCCGFIGWLLFSGCALVVSRHIVVGICVSGQVLGGWVRGSPAHLHA